jgi:hypothetical protein
MFITDYSMSALELARALEEPGFESVSAPEHSHIPLSRKTPFPGGGDLPKQYYDAMDPSKPSTRCLFGIGRSVFATCFRVRVRRCTSAITRSAVGGPSTTAPAP